MFTFNAKLIATHKGKDHNSHETTNIYKSESYTTVEVIQKNSVGPAAIQRIAYRNVGPKHQDTQIQFEIEKIKNNRTTYFSFSIPAPLVDIFLEGLKCGS